MRDLRPGWAMEVILSGCYWMRESANLASRKPDAKFNSKFITRLAISGMNEQRSALIGVIN